MLLNPERNWLGTVTSLNRTTLLPEEEAEAAVEHNCLVGLMISTWLVDTPKLQLLTTLLQMTVSSDLLKADMDQPRNVIVSCIYRVREPHASETYKLPPLSKEANVSIQKKNYTTVSEKLGKTDHRDVQTQTKEFKCEPISGLNYTYRKTA
ncbi:hypothetical protein STEG23_017708 [Scotinomys teguina]